MTGYRRAAAIMATAPLLAAGLLATGAGAATLEDVARAMGTGKVETIHLSGQGTFYGAGQSFRPGMRWPRFNMIRASRAYDYAKGIFLDDFVLTQAENPPRGGARQPIFGEQRRTGGVAGDQAWTMQGPFAVGSDRFLADLQHELWISPHGAVKAGLAAKARMVRGQGGWSFAIARPGRFTATVFVDARNRVVRIDARVANAVLGDMRVVTSYAGYKSFDGVLAPTRILQSAGGFPVLDLTVSEVRVNAGGIVAPRAIRANPNNVKADKAADGVWFLHGGSHHSIAVEMRDHVILFECPLGDERVDAVIAAVKQNIPGKPIRYAVNTHHHFDHSGGLRGCAAEGAILVTHRFNVAFFQQAYTAPRKLAPDRLATAGKPPRFLPVGEKLVLSDGARTLELHRLQGNTHNDGLIVGYLPKEKILMVADAFSPRAPITKKADNQNPFTTNLWANLQRLKLDVKTILPIHGRMVDARELATEVGATN